MKKKVSMFEKDLYLMIQIIFFIIYKKRYKIYFNRKDKIVVNKLYLLRNFLIKIKNFLHQNFLDI